MKKEFEYDQFIHGYLQSDKEFLDEPYKSHGFFEMQMEPLKTFTFLRDWYMGEKKYGIEPARQGISKDGDPFLAYKPRKKKKTDIEEFYIETYEGSVVMVIKTSLEVSVREYFSLAELCNRIDEIIYNGLL